MHGTADPISPFEGGPTSLFGMRSRGTGISAPDTVAFFAKLNGHRRDPIDEALPGEPGTDGTRVTRRTYRDRGLAPVVAYTVVGGGHVVPTPHRRRRQVMGRNTVHLDTARVVHDFVAGLRPRGDHPVQGDAPGRLTHVLRIEAERAGGPDVLRAHRRPVPLPGPREILIEIEAAGVASADVQRRRGLLPVSFPFTPGHDVVGWVLTVGAAVTVPAVGDRVAAFTGTGGYATAAIARAELAVVIDEALPAADATAMVLNYTTAWQLLHRATQVRPGATVLVLGAGRRGGIRPVRAGSRRGSHRLRHGRPDPAPALEGRRRHPARRSAVRADCRRRDLRRGRWSLAAA